VVAAKFNIVATGGTFDEIHVGHLGLLSKAFEVGKKVIIGVSSDELAANVKGKSKLTHRYQERVTNLEQMIKKNLVAQFTKSPSLIQNMDQQ
jgi:pantetheine-phosphate adenylyltransferase